MTKNEIEKIIVTISLGDLERLRCSATAYKHYHDKYEKLLKCVCDEQNRQSSTGKELLQKILNGAES